MAITQKIVFYKTVFARRVKPVWVRMEGPPRSNGGIKRRKTRVGADGWDLDINELYPNT